MYCPNCGVLMEEISSTSKEVAKYECPKCGTHWELKVLHDGNQLIAEYVEEV